MPTWKAAQQWVNDEFQPSVLTVEEQMAEMQWFVDAAKPFVGMEINVLSETFRLTPMNPRC